jgi:hypothetical protein
MTHYAKQMAADKSFCDALAKELQIQFELADGGDSAGDYVSFAILEVYRKRMKALFERAAERFSG